MWRLIACTVLTASFTLCLHNADNFQINYEDVSNLETVGGKLQIVFSGDLLIFAGTVL